MKLPLILCLFLALVATSFAQTPDAETQKLIDGLNFQKGDITLQGGLAKIHLPEQYRYLGPKDAEIVLSRIWGNPPDSRTLGMIMPANVSPTSENSWAVIVTYDEDGYVKDDDARTINYDKLLTQMKEGVKKASKEREKAGYPAIELVGWATPPRYDETTHKMYWAKELRFADSPENTLNYNIRMLGRRGVLVLNAVASMEQLAEIEAATPAVLAMVDFQEGHRYTDFNASTDKVATYGLAALVAGGLATKAGLFKGLIAALVAGKKFVLVGVVALFAYLKRVFGKKE
jgi:uncharacterized membrane-anchored protein